MKLKQASSHTQHKDLLPANLGENGETKDESSIHLDDLESIYLDELESLSYLDHDENTHGKPGKPPKEHRRRSLELSCVNLKIDLAERSTALDAIQQELNSSHTEKNVLSDMVAFLQTQLSEMQAKADKQAQMIHQLRKDAKEWSLERVKLRVQVESLQAECSRRRLETRRFSDESARATTEVKEMSNLVHLLRRHTERLMLEKVKRERRLATLEEMITAMIEGEIPQHLLMPKTQMHSSQSGGIRTWFGPKHSNDDAEEWNRCAESLSGGEEDETSSCSMKNNHSISTVNDKTRDEASECLNTDDFKPQETPSQESSEALQETESIGSKSVQSALASSPRLKKSLIPNWNVHQTIYRLAEHLKVSDQLDPEETGEDFLKQNITQKIRKSFFRGTSNEEELYSAADEIKNDEEDERIQSTESHVCKNCCNFTDTEAIADGESTLESENSETFHLSCSDLSFSSQDVIRQCRATDPITELARANSPTARTA